MSNTYCRFCDIAVKGLYVNCPKCGNYLPPFGKGERKQPEPYVLADYGVSLERSKMRTVTIAFDVDGTLRSNVTETTEDPNDDIVTLFRILNKFKNIELHVWSGGGAEYARRFARLYGLPVKDDNCHSKFDAWRPDIAIDDIQDTNLGKINLIVRQK
jgi:hypothetical protein